MLYTCIEVDSAELPNCVSSVHVRITVEYNGDLSIYFSFSRKSTPMVFL